MHIRPIEPADAAAYRSILLRTSDEDRYCRFFRAVSREPDPAEIRRYTSPGAGMAAFIAFEERPLGAVHGFMGEDGTVEFSVLVAQDARRRGVARSLVNVLIDDLADSSYVTLIAFSLSDNVAFARLARSLGMKRRDEGNVVTWTLSPIEARRRIETPLLRVSRAAVVRARFEDVPAL